MGRPRIVDDEKVVTWSSSISIEMERELEVIQKVTHLSKGKLGGLLMKRGLAAYKRDQLLDEPVKKQEPLIVDRKEDLLKKKAS